MSEVKKSKPKTTKHTALKTLSTELDGKVKAGGECNCTEKELALFKKVKAI